MNIQGTLGALLVVPMLATLAGCVAPGSQGQGLQGSQMASGNAPCTPSTTDNLISTGRSLLSIANSVLETKNSFNGDTATYDQRMQLAENAQKVNKGNQMLDNVESMTAGLKSPCATATQTSAAR
ncbi:MULTISPECIES: hypothetical protein [unclassified Pseudomonas]|uniref:hypothetical protein n=1 Tax=unclassified Pseudomonas TaxID=196821 RepID=UPI00244CF72F|nr:MULTISPECIES: hypothetical protein [unclassified Pseudomonas]MDH0301403.1 hypothetical protein [Pseudomonas sp. GD04091]MDH1985841.1 hypothetical protein [Pseudomonas sp. GD03689]